MRTIRSKLKLLTTASMLLVFVTFVFISFFSLNSLSQEFAQLLAANSGVQSKRIQDDSERVKDRFLDLFESAARRKGENLLDKDALVLKDAYLSNSYSSVIDYLKKTFDFDSDIMLASFFILEDGELQAWQYLSREFPNGLGLGLRYDFDKKAWARRGNGNLISIPDPRIESIIKANERQVLKTYVTHKGSDGKEMLMPALEVITPITDGTYSSVEAYRSSGYPLAYLRYVISLEKLNQELEIEEKALKEKLADLSEKDQLAAARVTDAISRTKLRTILFLVGSGIVTLILVQFASVYFAKKISTPVEKLTIAADIISKGDYGQTVTAYSDDEVGHLAEIFESMRKRVKDFTEHLQDLVDQRTLDLQNALRLVTIEKQKIETVFDRIEQGILIVLPDLHIEEQYSRFTETLIPGIKEEVRTGNIETILLDRSTLSGEEKSLAIQPLLTSLGSSKLNWEVNSAHLANRLSIVDPSGRKRSYELQWSPIVDENDDVQKVLLAIKDLTEQLAIEEATRQKTETMNKLTARLANLLKDRIQSPLLIQGSLQRITDLIQNENLSRADALVDLHTMKGNFRSKGFKDLAELIHETESQINDLQNAKAVISHEDLKLMNPLLNVLKEYDEIITTVFQPNKDAHHHTSLFEYLGRDIQEIRDRALKEGLTIDEFHISDRIMFWKHDFLIELTENIRHGLTNSLDHGYLRPVRERGWKPKLLAFNISAFRVAMNVVIEIGDRGAGIDLDSLAEHLHKRKIPFHDLNDPVELAEKLSIEDFTTTKTLSQTSGRGIGITAIAKFVRKHEGELRILRKEEGGVLLRMTFPQATITSSEGEITAA